MKLARFFIITVLAGLISFCSSTKSSKTDSGVDKDKPVPPPGAAAAGYTKLAFYDDFESVSSIDMEAAGCPESGGCPEEGREVFKWFRAGKPFGFKATPAEEISVKDGILYFDQVGPGIGFGLMTTYAKKGGSFGGFTVKNEGAYFEASISFPTPPEEWYAQNTRKPWRKSYPAFWSMDVCHLYGNCTPYMELDFFEYLSYYWVGKDTYGQALHRWLDLNAMGIPCGGTDQPRCHQIEQSNQTPPNKKGYLGEPGIRSNNIVKVPDNTDWSGRFNTIATMLKKGEGFYSYFNNELVSSNTYEEYPWMRISDDGEFPLIIGSNDWPMKVDWVRVWVKP